MANLLSTTVNGSLNVQGSSMYVTASQLHIGKASSGTAQMSFESWGSYTGAIAMNSSGAFHWGGQGNSEWYFKKNNTYNGDYSASGTTVLRIASDGNIYSAYYGDWLSNVFNSKQNASTAITTSNIGSQSVNYATSAGNADTVDGRHADYFYPASTDNGYSTGDIYGSTTQQRLWGTDSVQNLLAFRPPTSIEYSTDGVNWTATTANTGLWDNKMFGKWGGFNMAVGNNVGGWRYVRMTWVNFGYHFFSHFTLAHSTNGHSFNFVFQKSDLNGNNFTEAFRQNGISSWPGYTFTKHSNVSGWWDTRDIRFVFELNHNNDFPNNSISVGHIGLMGGYSGFTRLYDWDADRNMFFGGVIYAATGNSNNWNTAYGWGNHATAGYQAASTAINTSNIGSQSVNYASSAGSVAWTNVSSRPTALSQFTNDLGNYGGFLTSLGFSYSTGVSANHVVQRDGNGYIYANHINFNTPETENPAISSFITSNGDGWSRKSSLAHVRNQLGNYGNWITTDGRAYPRRSDGTNINFYWSGQSGQPTWLWGSNDGENFYVWNPSNFSVNYADESGYSASSGSVEWTSVQNKPATFAPSTHNHDDRYYTESESDGRFLIGTTNPGSVANFTISIGNNGSYSYVQSHSGQPLYLNPVGNAIYLNSTTTVAGTAQFNSNTTWFSGRATIGLENQSEFARFAFYGLSLWDWDHGEQMVVDGNYVYINNYLQAGNSLRAPIFYDSNDTGYYLDLNSTSNSAMRIRGGTLYGPNPTWGASLYVGTDGRVGSSATVAVTNGNLHIDSQNGYGLYLNWYSTNNIYTQANLGIGSDSASYRLHVHGTGYATTDFRAPIFYDSENTAYYLDPNSTSYLYGLQLSGSNYFRPSNWIQLDSNYGLYWPNHNGAHIYAHTGSYGSIRVDGSRNGWRGISFDASVTLMMNDNESGHYKDGYGWQFRWEGGTLYCHKNTYGGGTAATVLDSSNYSSWAQPASTAINTSNIGSQSVNYANSAGNSTNLDGRSSSRYLYYRGINAASDFQTYQSSDSVIRFDQVNDYNTHSNPPGGYTYGGVLSMRGDNFGFQLWASHTGDFYFKTQWNNDQYSGWRYIVHSGNIGGASVSYATTAGNTNSISNSTGNGHTWTGQNYFRTNNGGYLGSLNSAPLQAYSDNNNSAYMSFHKGGHYAVNFGLDADNVIRLGGWSAASNRMQLDMSGNVTFAGDVTAYSDARVKTNVKTLENALDKTLKLRGVSYNRIDSDDTSTKIGVIAQEILEVVPEVVNQDNDGMYNVSYGNITALLIEAIKEQQKQIEELKSVINGLTK